MLGSSNSGTLGVYRLLPISLLVVLLLTTAARGGSHYQETKDQYYKSKKSIVSPASLLDIIGFENINWPAMYGVNQTDKLNARFDCRGTFGGWGFYQSHLEPAWPDVEFESPPGSGTEFIWGGEIWIGGIVNDDTLVTAGPYSAGLPGEFTPDYWNDSGAVRPISGYPGRSMRAVFTDTADFLDYGWKPEYHRPLNVRVVNRAHVWPEEPFDRAVVYDLIITNIGRETITDGYFGLFFDPDIMSGGDLSGYYDDFCGSLKHQQIIYALDADGDPVGGSYDDPASIIQAFGLKILCTSFENPATNFNWYSRTELGLFSHFTPITQAERDGGATGYEFPPEERDANKYLALSQPAWDYDQSAIASIMPEMFQTEWVYPDPAESSSQVDGGDQKFLLSTGPFELQPDSSVRIIYSTFLGDSVHQNPSSMSYLPHFPDAYLAELRLDQLLATAAAAQQMADSLLSPVHPPTGLSISRLTDDSVRLRWDPQVIGPIAEVVVALLSVGILDWPYPDVFPPWPQQVQIEEMILVESGCEVTLANLPLGKRYAVHLSYQFNGVTGHPTSDTWLTGSPAPPPVVAENLFVIQGETGELNWTKPYGTEPAAYNLYRFADSTEASKRYQPFYSLNGLHDSLAPVDSFFVDDTTYYYYALTPFTTLDGSLTRYETSMIQGETFVLTAVDSFGVQSQMSRVATVQEMLARTADILVLTNSQWSLMDIAGLDSIVSFYQEVLGSTGLSWELKDIAAECFSLSNCPDWLELSQYRLVIVDDNYLDQLPNRQYEEREAGFTKYLTSGGKLAYFGSFSTFVPLYSTNMAPGYHPLKHKFIRDHFGVDSVFFVGLNHYVSLGAREVDSLFGFSQAEALEGSGLPTLDCDTARYPMGTTWASYWPDHTPPLVSAFKLSSRGEVTHRYRALYPDQSMVAGAPVGVRTATSGTETYLFGFHLYYMKPDQARGLILSILDSESSCCGRFTEGFTGNVNCDRFGTRDLVDIVRLIDYIFLSKAPLCCGGNANIDGSPDGSLNLADIIAMIDHVYLLKNETAACQ